MPKIKAKTLRREQKLTEHLNKFNNLKGCYASTLDAKSYEKVPPPELKVTVMLVTSLCW